ncbi:MAG: acyl-CoA thioesterase [Candidatus Acidiferrales bacterium]
MNESSKRQAASSGSGQSATAHTHDTVVRVRYAETDKMGVVYYGNYYIYFEIGRVEYMRNLGIDYRRMEIEDDSLIVVAESSCRYRRPARYDDPLRIRTRILSVKRRTIHFGYEILHDETGELLATGETVHVVCNNAGRPKALPEKYRGILEGAVSLPERLEEE